MKFFKLPLPGLVVSLLLSLLMWRMWGRGHRESASFESKRATSVNARDVPGAFRARAVGVHES